jgi:type II secretory pathway pseudopilin PulG
MDLWKTCLSRSGLTRLEVLVLLGVFGIFGALVLPVFTSSVCDGGREKVVSNAKQIALVLFLYAGDHDGRFPEARSNANEAFQQLLSGYLSSKGIFVDRRSPWTPEYPDESGPAKSQLAAGENAFAYVCGLNRESNPEFPLVAQGFAEGSPGVYTLNPQVKGGVGSERRAAVIRVDGSGRFEKVSRWEYRVYKKTGPFSKIDIFASAPGWLAPDQVPLNPASE